MATQRARILIVDDEMSILEIISRKLSSEGHQCTTATNADDALKELQEAPYDIALVDVRMPGKSGMELLRDIRISYPDTAVVMVTVVTNVMTAIEAMRLGASDYIQKPFDLDKLSLTVERVLETQAIVSQNREYRLHLEEKVMEQTQKLRELFLNALKPIVQGVDDRDRYWHGHSQRAIAVAAALARELSLPEESVEKIRQGMQLCDTGRIGVKEEILHKPGPLTEKEYEHVMEHPALGERLLSPILNDSEVLAVIKHHHERWDGTGKPQGLKGPAIPLLARVAAVADAFVAMTSPRPYRSPLSLKEAKSEIMKGSGTFFDPHVVSAFQRLSDSELANIVNCAA